MANTRKATGAAKRTRKAPAKKATPTKVGDQLAAVPDDAQLAEAAIAQAAAQAQAQQHPVVDSFNRVQTVIRRSSSLVDAEGKALTTEMSAQLFNDVGVIGAFIQNALGGGVG